MTQATLKRIDNQGEFAFGPRPYGHHRQHGRPAAVRKSRWEIRLGPDQFGTYPTKTAALADVERFGLVLTAQ